MFAIIYIFASHKEVSVHRALYSTYSTNKYAESKCALIRYTFLLVVQLKYKR